MDYIDLAVHCLQKGGPPKVSPDVLLHHGCGVVTLSTNNISDLTSDPLPVTVKADDDDMV